MLNKLLKRCMPWMDKGRWYHVGVTMTETESKVDYDDIFAVVTFNDTTLEISFKEPGIYDVLDVKCSCTTIGENTDLLDRSYITLKPDNEILYHTGGSPYGDVIEIPVGIDPLYRWEYWFFVSR